MMDDHISLQGIRRDQDYATWFFSEYMKEHPEYYENMIAAYIVLVTL